MCQCHEQCCFVLEHARELAKKFFDARTLWKISEFVGKNLFFFVFLRLPEVCGKLANILSVDLFLDNTSALCPWPRAILSLASRESVLGRCILCLGFFVSLILASNFVSWTSPLHMYDARFETCLGLDPPINKD